MQYYERSMHRKWLFSATCAFILIIKLTKLLSLIDFQVPGGPPGSGPPGPTPFKLNIVESIERIKEEFNFLQAQYHKWVRVTFTSQVLLKTAVHEFHPSPYLVKIAGIFFSLLMATERALQS